MTNQKAKFNRLSLTIPAVVFALFGGGEAGLAQSLTDLADKPLANTTTVSIQPNLAIVIDDSGSMDEENIPDSGNTNKSKVCYKWHGYNGLAYNPGITYTPPIKADGTRYPDALFSAALKDGYFASGQKMYDGNTDNTATNLNSLVTPAETYANIWMPNFRESGKNIPQRATSVRVTLLNGTTIELLGTSPIPAAYNSDEDAVGQAIATAINANSGATGFSASYADRDRKPATGEFAGTQFYGLLTLTAPENQYGLATRPSITFQRSDGKAPITVSAEVFTNVTATGLFYSIANNASSTSCEDNTEYTKIQDAADIAAPDVSTGSAAALTNYANWYSYYRKRAYLMKAAVGEAFSKLDEGKYRIGYFTIDSLESGVEEEDGSPVNHDLAIDAFTGKISGTHRATWFDRLYGTRKAGYTPLRGALSRMGRMYAGKISGWDPVQYSCQKNFTILTTDGYWNTDAEDNSGTARYGAYRIDNSTLVGDQDKAATLPEFDKLAKSNTLADVAYYYYHTDLRTESLGNCTRTVGSDTYDLCTDNVPSGGTDTKVDDVATHQHMTTFTLGLGVNGTLEYRSDYKSTSANSGGYYDILQETKWWPDPIGNSGAERIDDLWHAAVNGRGQYFSARNPTSLAKSLADTLLAIDKIKGSGAAAATGSLQPTAGDPLSNYLYIASYYTNSWYGDVAAHTFDLNTGTVDVDPEWTAGTLLDARITGSGSSDTRTIYAWVDGVRKSFDFDNLNATQKAYFDNTKLSQYAGWSDEEKDAASGASMVAYLRGQYANEDREGNATKLYRSREHVLGDIVHSQPVYVKVSASRFDDSHDPTFGGRMGMLYVAANDGMLHAFCTESSGDCSPGKELWAYVIPPVMKNMAYLADKKQLIDHHFFVDGPITIGDAYIDGGWKTILVGALGKGGRGYYAFDITDPTDPDLLWTFTADDDHNMGYSYGAALITKVPAKGNLVGSNSEWRFLLPSGYNNVQDPDTGEYPNGDGGGYLYIIDANGDLDGDPIATGNKGNSPPSGLANIEALVPSFSTDNSAQAVFGGDLLGDMWRFDLGERTATKVLSLGSGRPITTATQIGDVGNGIKVVYFGSGSYLGENDLAATSGQVIVGVRADATNLTLSDLVLQDGTKTIDWTEDKGWRYELTGQSERVHISPQLYLGTLMFATVLPNATECSPGGTSRLYFFDYSDGSAVDGADSLFVTYNDPLVGMSAVFPEGGSPMVLGITSKGEVPTGQELPIGGGSGEEGDSSKNRFTGYRIMWRELID